MALSPSGKILAALLVLYVVCGLLLTPLSGIETRPGGDLTTVGIITLSIFLVGLVLDVAAIFLLFRRVRLASALAAIGTIVFLPAFLADRTGGLSSLSAPVAIVYIEWIAVVILIPTIFFALRVRKEGARTG